MLSRDAVKQSRDSDKLFSYGMYALKYSFSYHCSLQATNNATMAATVPTRAIAVIVHFQSIGFPSPGYKAI